METSDYTLTGDGEVEYEVTVVRRAKRREVVKDWKRLHDTINEPEQHQYDYVETDAVLSRETTVFKQVLPADMDLRRVVAALNDLPYAP